MIHTYETSETLYRQALLDFGAPMEEIDQKTFTEKSLAFQIGVAPRRLDILTEIDGVEFSKAYQAREEIELGDLNVPFLSKDHVIQNKKATGRKQDELDVEYLRGPNSTPKDASQE